MSEFKHGIDRPFDISELLPSNDYGFTEVEVLDFLWGTPFDDVAASFISTLRPSCVRFCRDSAKTDARLWRVTVWLDENDLIEEITQEVEIRLPKDHLHGASVRAELIRRSGLDLDEDTNDSPKASANFKIDLTNTSTSYLLLMLRNHDVFRDNLTFHPDHESRGVGDAYGEIHAEIDRRIPVPGRKP